MPFLHCTGVESLTSAKLELDTLQQHSEVMRSKLSESEKHVILFSSPPAAVMSTFEICKPPLSSTRQSDRRMPRVQASGRGNGHAVVRRGDDSDGSSASRICCALESPESAMVKKSNESDCAVALGCSPS